MSKEEQLLFKKNSFLEKELTAKNRELEIEASLEQVREKATAMRASEELNVLIATVFVELTKLDLVLTRCVIMIYDTSRNGFHWWMANSETPSVPMNFFVKDTNLPFFNAYLEGWQERTMKWTFELEGENKIRVDDFLFTKTELSLLPDFVISGMRAPEKVFLNASFNNFGNLTLASLEPLTDEQFQIMLRFAKVFDLTYTRFNDLKKAEGQTREAQIELALERVRAAAMGMKQPSDMLEVCKIISEQLSGLNVEEIRNVQTAIIYETRHSYINYEYYAKHDKTFITEVDFTDHSVKSAFANQMLKGKGYFFSTTLEGEKLEEFIEHQKEGPEFIDPFLSTSPSVTWYWYSLGPVALGISTYSPLNENEVELFKRFRNVFELAYRRYLDIENAEAQAREAKIQLALERVRARTMAMQKSDELSETVFVLFQQFKELGENPDQATIGVMNEDEKVIEYWVTMYGQPINKVFKFPIDEPNVTNKIYKAWKENKKSLVINLSGKALTEFMAYRAEKGGAAVNPDEKRRTINVAFFSKGLLNVQSNEERSEESIKLLERFASVFDQTYTRFLDLKKAESQAKEAQIEAALERVRSRSMAMHKSDELKEAGELLWNELSKLGIQSLSSGYVLMDKNEKIGWFYAPNPATGKISEPLGCLHTETKEMLEVLSLWKKQEPLSIIEMNEQETISHQTFIAEKALNLNGTISGWITAEELIALSPKRLFLHNFNFKEGYLVIVGGNRLNEQQIELMRRFTKVFQQTYTRFLDLQKAEAQTRESQIQLALERVRARTMAMQKSDELKDATLVLFQQFRQLQQTPNQVSICIFDDEVKTGEMYFTLNGEKIDRSFKMGFDEETFVMKKARKSFLHKKDSFSITITGKELKKYNQWRNAFVGVKRWDESDNAVNEAWHVQGSFFSKGMVGISSDSPIADETSRLLERFTKVFDGTYRRFLDLQKAEAQAREAQIQLALERVRAKTTAMQKPSEFVDVINIIGEQFMHLGFDFDWVNFSANGVDVSKAIDIYNFHVIPGLYQGATRVIIPFFEHPVFKKAEESVNEYRTSGNNFTVVLLDKKDKDTWLNHLFTNTIYKDLPDEAKTSQYNCEVYQSSNVVLKDTWLSVGKYDSRPLTNEQITILKRLANEFGQAYTRFLDLQKAEAQAREAQIEAALERVRAKAMAMHNSNDVSVAASMVFTELRKLCIDPIRCGVGLLNNESRKAQLYSATSSSDGDSLSLVGWVMLTGHPVLENIYDTWMKKEDYYPELTGTQLKSYYENLLAGLSLPIVPNWKTGEKQYGHFFSFSVGCLYTWSERHYNASEIKILKRFAAIIDLTFRRYLDLQKAEANAKEATIEASLERVRGKAMAMHTSQDLSDTIGVFYHELKSFSLTPMRCGVGLLDREERVGEMFTWNTTEQGDSLELVGRLKMEGHAVLYKVYESWLTQTEYHPVLRGDQIKEYNNILKPQMAFPEYKKDDVQFGYFFFFPEGGVYAWTEKEMQLDEVQIYRRFTSVLSLTYKRYRDLQKAEASAKEAVKQSALDRIRADIASMRTVSDLDRITPLIWNELTILRVPFIRCGVFIMDDDQEQIHTFLSTPEGKGIAAFHLSYNTPGNIAHVITHWKKKEIYTDHWDEKAFKEFADNLVQQGAMKSSEQYLSTMPPGGFHLHFVPFQQGMLYVGNVAPLGEEEINLLQSIADAFSTAYARYEDFNKLEAAKKQVDNTLTELKQAQQQLVQSEKMASLGELTAGIAHEIQNPLNFVNNFSDVNSELIGEMENELQNGNVQEAILIAIDIKENEEKINHHGKRADAIVKGMLQHSRKSSGQKESTDINTLADEYLRLSYHGLRAKDKNFNATIETDFNKSIGKINIIPQDIGRVLLNLFNNAFYAVNVQKTLNTESYNPTIFVSTKKSINKIQLTVRDNGNGIPQKILDKIFQPFFTTKPTGQGTGLGLSLSYDIIKAHGGEINVQSKEGEGSEFIIQLPFA